MWKDPIVAEVRAAREAYSKRFGHDLRKIAADLQKKEKARAGSSRRKPSKAHRTAAKPTQARAPKRGKAA